MAIDISPNDEWRLFQWGAAKGELKVIGSIADWYGYWDLTQVSLLQGFD
jgi:hypothetical protein